MLLSARENLSFFLEFESRGKWQPAKHLELLCDKLEAVERGELKRLMVFMPPRFGKALALDTPVPTPDGWKLIKDLKPGDAVFAIDGTITRVVGVSPIWKNRPVYKITTDTGTSVIADAAHEWYVRLDRKRKVFSIRETQFLYERQKRMREFRAPMIPMHSGLELPERDLPIPPYTLGVWLGDGRSSMGFITQSEEDKEHILSRIREEGFITRPHKDKKNTGILGLQTLLRENNLLDNKHIPPQYLRASREQRIALLQGLIDTDGYVAPNGCVEFSTTNERLAKDVAELVRSLGVKCSILKGTATLYGKICGDKWRVIFYFSEAASLPRKRKYCRNATKSPGNYINIEPAGYADTICIEVEHPSHLFLVGEGMIPTHNSEVVSKKFPVWFLGRNPDKEIIISSYSAELAFDFSRIARDTFKEWGPKIFGVEISKTLSSVERWGLQDHRGGLTAAGVGGPITGRGAHVAIIDDPVKNWEEAQSDIIREKIWDWYRSTLRTRLAPNGAIVLVMTRWHEDDLAGRLLKQAEKDGEKWDVISLPALAEENDILGRKVGEPLWPERFSLEEIESIKAALGNHMFTALYQQRPQPAEGGLFKKQYFKHFTIENDYYVLDGNRYIHKNHCWIFQVCDPAISTKETADYFVLQTWAVTPESDLLLLDNIRTRIEGPDQVDLIVNNYYKWKPAYVGIEKVAYQTALIQMVLRKGIPIRELEPDKDKWARAQPLAARYENGKVYHLSGAEWLNDFENELLMFPNGTHDDQVDAAAYAALEMFVPHTKSEKKKSIFEIAIERAFNARKPKESGWF